MRLGNSFLRFFTAFRLYYSAIDCKCTDSTNLTVKLNGEIPFESRGLRLDQAVANLFPEYSRARIQAWIKQGQLTINNRLAKTKDKVKGGEKIAIDAVLPKEVSWAAEAIALDIIYEDEDLLIINKPAGLVVHPAAGNYEGTLLNALLHHVPTLAHVPRAGIVHRLDKDTTGIMMVAKTLQAHTFLVKQLQKRLVSREYEAVVQGVLTAGGTIDLPIGRHPTQRTKMTIIESGREAVTHYRILKKFAFHTYLKVNLETGRTHQIRVHLAYKHFPLVGDKTYGGRLAFPKGMDDTLKNYLRHFPRQALHAKQLSLTHPRTHQPCTWSVPLPADMQQLLKTLGEN